MEDNYDDSDDDAPNLISPVYDPTAHIAERADPTAVHAPLLGSSAPEPEPRPEPHGGVALPRIGEGILKFSALFSAVPTAAFSADGAIALGGRKRSRDQASAPPAAAAPPPTLLVRDSSLPGRDSLPCR